MKFLIPLLSFFLGNAKNFFREPSQALTQQVIMHARSITLLAICAIGSLALSCVGISLLIANIATQLDASAEFHFTAGTFVYLVMSLFFGVALVFTMRKETWLRSVEPESIKTSTAKKGSPIENAIALVVMDFLEERQQRREASKNEKPQG